MLSRDLLFAPSSMGDMRYLKGGQIDCKTVVFFANASDTVKYYSNERSGASVETARGNGV